LLRNALSCWQSAVEAVKTASLTRMLMHRQVSLADVKDTAAGCLLRQSLRWIQAAAFRGWLLRATVAAIETKERFFQSFVSAVDKLTAAKLRQKCLSVSIRAWTDCCAEARLEAALSQVRQAAVEEALRVQDDFVRIAKMGVKTAAMSAAEAVSRALKSRVLVAWVAVKRDAKAQRVQVIAREDREANREQQRSFLRHLLTSWRFTCLASSRPSHKKLGAAKELTWARTELRPYLRAWNRVIKAIQQPLQRSSSTGDIRPQLMRLANGFVASASAKALRGETSASWTAREVQKMISAEGTR